VPNTNILSASPSVPKLATIKNSIIPKTSPSNRMKTPSTNKVANVKITEVLVSSDSKTNDTKTIINDTKTNNSNSSTPVTTASKPPLPPTRTNQIKESKIPTLNIVKTNGNKRFTASKLPKNQSSLNKTIKTNIPSKDSNNNNKPTMITTSKIMPTSSLDDYIPLDPVFALKVEKELQNGGTGGIGANNGGIGPNNGIRHSPAVEKIQDPKPRNAWSPVKKKKLTFEEECMTCTKKKNLTSSPPPPNTSDEVGLDDENL